MMQKALEMLRDKYSKENAEKSGKKAPKGDVMIEIMSGEEKESPKEESEKDATLEHIKKMLEDMHGESEEVMELKPDSDMVSEMVPSKEELEKLKEYTREKLKKEPLPGSKVSMGVIKSR